MVLADFAAVNRSAQSPLFAAVRDAARWVARRHEMRTRKSALRDLLFAPEHRLRDIGITRAEVFNAIEARRRHWPL